MALLRDPTPCVNLCHADSTLHCMFQKSALLGAMTSKKINLPTMNSSLTSSFY